MSESYERDKVFGYFVDRTARLIKSDISRRFKSISVDLTPEQWLILDRLGKKDGRSQVEIGEGTYKDAPTISRIVDLLCKKGFTVRKLHEKDRRKFNIYITEAGRTILARSSPEVIQARKDGWKGLKDEDYDHLIRIVNKVFDNLS